MKNFVDNRILLTSSAIACAVLLSTSASAQVANLQITNKGVSPASNTFGSFNNSSLTRDRDVQNALDLLADFYPSVTVSYTQHDNIRRRNDVQESDSRLVIEPSLAYRNDFGRHSLYLSGSLSTSKHNEFDQEDTDTTNLRGLLRLDVSKRFDVEINASLLNTFEERGASGTRTLGSQGQLVNADEFDQGPDEVDINTIGADLIYGRGISRLNAIVGVEQSSTEFQNNFQDGTLFADRDRDVDSIHFDVSYELGAKLRAFGRLEQSEIDYSRSSDSLDSDLDTILVGLRYSPSAKLNGVLSVGKQDKDFESESREDYDGSSYYANLNYALKPYSVISLNASQLVEEAADDSSDFFVSELIGLSWSHALNERWSVGAYTKTINDEFNNGREDDFDDIGLSVDYTWSRWLTAGLQFGKIERESNRAGIAYEDQYVGLTLRSDLRKF